MHGEAPRPSPGPRLRGTRGLEQRKTRPQTKRRPLTMPACACRWDRVEWLCRDRLPKWVRLNWTVKQDKNGKDECALVPEARRNSLLLTVALRG
jgi:hypothetical protein